VSLTQTCTLVPRPCQQLSLQHIRQITASKPVRHIVYHEWGPFGLLPDWALIVFYKNLLLLQLGDRKEEGE
jgi:hypothetical protein